ncbi:MAG: hypothetical protein PHV50_02955 [Syntrophaceticus sp.]|nr:hypothetical protein [Syntrophaceticus sp.]MDD3314474.1 hypothetical protein [Syntrophaceticus sp.]MDD4359503.1 hypothetical protein [Syntrophaceticus sp.]
MVQTEVLFVVSKEKTGFVCDKQRLIYVTYSQEDFEELWGGDLNAYKDFLLARQREFQRWQEDHFGAWILLVPFDKEDYSRWLKENPLRNNYRDKHASWALWVAQKPEQLKKIRDRHPLQNYILKDESLQAFLFGWFLPVIINNSTGMRLLKRTIPQDVLCEIRQELISQSMQPFPEFRRISALRCSGATILLGDRLVYPDAIDQSGKQIEESLITSWKNTSPLYLNMDELLGTNPLPINPHWRYPKVAVVCLPVAVLGCAFDCETITVQLSRTECSDLPMEIWRNYFHPYGIELYPGKGADFAVAGYTKHIHNEIERDLPSENELHKFRQPPHREYIWRIK